MPNSSKRASHLTEHQEQKLLIEWARYHPWHNLLFAIPNGGHRHIVTAKKLKAEGVKAGVPDLFLAIPSQEYCGLWVELKAKNGKPSKNQIEMIQLLREQGYRAEVCYGFEDAKNLIREYLDE